MMGRISTNGAIAILEYMNKNIDVMESIIIKEIEMMLELPLHERQKAYFQDLLNAAKPVTIVPAADVLEDYELDYISRKNVIEIPIYFARRSRNGFFIVREKQTSQYRLTMRLTRSATHILTLHLNLRCMKTRQYMSM